MGFIQQDDQDAHQAWSAFILDKSEGFTNTGGGGPER